MAPKKKARVEVKIPDLQWQWCDGDDKLPTATWKDFEDADAKILEKNFAAKNFSFSTGEMSFAIGNLTDYDLVAGTQTNQTTKVVRRIRRLVKGTWEYVDDHGMFIAFYDEDNNTIEQAWRSLPPVGGVFVTTDLSWNKGYDSKYTFTFTVDESGSAVALQKNEDSGNVRKLRRTTPDPAKIVWETKGFGISSLPPPTLTSEDIAPPPSGASSAVAGAEEAVAPSAAVSAAIFAPPAYWQPQTKPFQMFDVPSGSKEYNDAIEPFLKTLKNKATIHSVQRIQNEVLWRFYALTRHRVALRNKGNPNEMNLYHGARVRENMNSIMEFGFDMRVARDGSAGVGIYFAVNASYSNAGYVLQNTDKSKEMFVCRVAVGSCVQGKHGLKRPPPKPAKKGDKDDLHDSVHNGLNVMFIVFDNFQAYPEYLIKYTNLTGW